MTAAPRGHAVHVFRGDPLLAAATQPVPADDGGDFGWPTRLVATISVRSERSTMAMGSRSGNRQMISAVSIALYPGWVAYEPDPHQAGPEAEGTIVLVPAELVADVVIHRARPQVWGRR